MHRLCSLLSPTCLTQWQDVYKRQAIVNAAVKKAYGSEHEIEWINTEGMECNEEFVGESFGRINKEEAAQMCIRDSTGAIFVTQSALYIKLLEQFVLNPGRILHFLGEFVNEDVYKRQH